MALKQTPEITHQLYPRVEDPKDADAVAWVFKNKSEFVPYYFKFQPIGEGEVRAKILYTGLCHSDSMTGREHWGPCHFPVCAGHEVIGEITLVGSAVKNFKVGDIVGIGPFRSACFGCEQCKEGNDNICCKLPGSERFLYGKYFGGYASHIQQPASHTFHIPQGMDLANVPPVLCAGCTVYPPMKRHITKKDATVGIIGIGGLGHLAVQYGKAMGCHVTGFTTSVDKVDYIKKLGAEEVIVVDKEQKELAKHGGKFDYLLNTLPVTDTNIIEAYLGTLKNGGTLIQVGIPDVKDNFSMSFFTLVARQLTVVGSIVSSVQDTKETLEFTNKHGIKVAVEEFSFADFPKALDRLENGRPQFRCVVNVKDYTNQFLKQQ